MEHTTGKTLSAINANGSSDAGEHPSDGGSSEETAAQMIDFHR